MSAASGSVSVTIAPPYGYPNLTGNVTVTAIGGVATFTGLSTTNADSYAILDANATNDVARKN